MRLQYCGLWCGSSVVIGYNNASSIVSGRRWPATTLRALLRFPSLAKCATTSAPCKARMALSVSSSGSPGPTPSPISFAGMRNTSGAKHRERVDCRGCHCTAAHAAAHRQDRHATGIAGERFLAFGGTDEAHRHSNDGRGPAAALKHFEQMKYRCGRIADRDQGAIEFFAP